MVSCVMTRWLWVIVVIQVGQIEVGFTSDVSDILPGSSKQWLYSLFMIQLPRNRNHVNFDRSLKWTVNFKKKKTLTF